MVILTTLWLHPISTKEDDVKEVETPRILYGKVIHTLLCNQAFYLEKHFQQKNRNIMTFHNVVLMF